MSLPNLSYMMTVGELRYIQAVFERPEFRNPDLAMRDFLSAAERWNCNLRGKFLLRRLRGKPFYCYLVARTKYYDEVFLDGVCQRVQYIVNIGCGSDTRAYRFGHLLRQKGIRVLECDQPEAIERKKDIASRRWPVDHVEYRAVDLNQQTWPTLEQWLGKRRGAKMLFMMEGVSPYIDTDAFDRLLRFLAAVLEPGSQIAYDYKVRGAADESEGSTATRNVFRLPLSAGEVVAYHESRGYRVDTVELSADLSLRLLPELDQSRAALFCEDGLVRMSVKEKSI